MAQQTLKEIISAYHRLPEMSLDRLVALAVPETYRRGEFIAHAGKYNAKEYVVLEGVCRSCIYGPDGEDTTLSFFMPGTVLLPYLVRTRQQRSVLNIQASTDLSIVNFDAEAFEQLMVDDVEIRAFGNEVLKRELVQMFQKEVGFASLTAKDRLIRLREEMPLLENLVPHAEIATYLGITTISLSRLRRELMHLNTS